MAKKKRSHQQRKRNERVGLYILCVVGAAAVAAAHTAVLLLNI